MARKLEYQWFVVATGSMPPYLGRALATGPLGAVISGWSFAEDAKDAARELREDDLPVVVKSRKALERAGYTRLPTGNFTRNPAKRNPWVTFTRRSHHGKKLKKAEQVALKAAHTRARKGVSSAKPSGKGWKYLTNPRRNGGGAGPSEAMIVSMLGAHFRHEGVDPKSAAKQIKEKMRTGGALELANTLLRAHGIESAYEPDNGYNFDYVNMGDIYTATLLFDRVKRRYYATSWGDYVESIDRRRGR